MINNTGQSGYLSEFRYALHLAVCLPISFHSLINQLFKLGYTSLMDKKNVERIIIDSLFLTAHRPESTLLKLEGVRGYLSPFKLAYANRVQLVNAFNVDSSIQSTIDFFKTRNAGLTWVVTSKDIDLGLPEKLVMNGFSPCRFHKISGMYLECSDAPLEENPVIKIEEIFTDGNTEMIARAYGYNDIDYPKYLYSVTSNHGDIQNRLYQAYVQDKNNPIGYGFCSYIENNSIALMRGAAVLPEYRGKGVYKALFRRRLADACQTGIQRFVTQAARDTSYSTCLSLGFEEICPLELYEWSP
jgi:GNAT superfamily N-acetyltransferase